MRTENSVTRVTVRHHEWCKTVIPSDVVFNLHRTTIKDSFSCILFLWQQHLSLNVCYFVSFTLRYLHFWSRHVLFRSYIRCWHQNVWRKMTSRCWCHAWELSYTPSCKTTFPSPGQVHGNSGQVCKNFQSAPHNHWKILIFMQYHSPVLRKLFDHSVIYHHRVKGSNPLTYM